MKFSVNVEFTDDELLKHAEDIGRRMTLNLVHQIMGHVRGFKIDPGVVDAVSQAIAAGMGVKVPEPEPEPEPVSSGPIPPGHVSVHHFSDQDDLLSKYDVMVRLWPANTIDVFVRRINGGSSEQYVLSSHPESGVKLYEALAKMHGQKEVAEYEVRFRDMIRKEYRGMGRITMPDTRDLA
jgi:hypothetical protein